jgi:hypothetical protein
MAQAFVAACMALLVGWVGFGVALAHAPADGGTHVAAHAFPRVA